MRSRGANSLEGNFREKGSMNRARLTSTRAPRMRQNMYKGSECVVILAL